MLWESLLWAEVEEGGKENFLPCTLIASITSVALVSFTRSWCLCLQVEEEATDKDNKNCSKDGMCGKVRLCLPLYNDSVIAWLDSSVSCFCGSKLVCLGCDFCCRIFSSCWGTEGMGPRRKGDRHLLNLKMAALPSQLSFGPDLATDPGALSKLITRTSFTLH